MKLRTFVVIFGVILILVQAIAFIGMNRMYVGLYPDLLDTYSPNFFYTRDVNIFSDLMFAVNAGYERFMTSFSDLTFDIENEYRLMSPTQIASAYIRDSLKYEPVPNFLFMYDTVLTISYCFTGIIGCILLLITPKIKN